jgi:hypothetical protein
MSKLYVFGCSHSALYSNGLVTTPDMEKYYEYRGGNFPPTWSELLARSLKLELVNTAKWGSDNYRIFETFCNKVDEIEDSDTVVIGWSGISRFSLYSEKYGILSSVNAWTTGTDIEFTNISKQTVNEVLVNRDNPEWLEEVYSWMKVIDKLSKLVGFKLYFWSFFDEFSELCIVHDLLKLGGEHIITETKGQVTDYHFGEKGHIVQSDYILNILKKKYKNLHD